MRNTFTLLSSFKSNSQKEHYFELNTGKLFVYSCISYHLLYLANESGDKCPRGKYIANRTIKKESNNDFCIN